MRSRVRELPTFGEEACITRSRRGYDASVAFVDGSVVYSPEDSGRFEEGIWLVKVALFVPCYVDQIKPEVGVSVVRVLRKLGVDVTYPEGQTCCGQPAFNSGFFDEARSVGRYFLDVFEE